MKPWTISIFFALAVADPSAASVEWTRGSADFEAPVRADKIILGERVVWRCQMARCEGKITKHPKTAERYCRELARRVGLLVGYEHDGAAYDDAKLQRCNNGR